MFKAVYIMVAAFRRLCLIQPMQKAVDWMVVESTTRTVLIPEPGRKPWIVPAGCQKSGIGLREQFADLPEQFLGHVRIACLFDL